ncbi:DUF2127 domain-containing protein [Citrifermentans bremense]|uniref:DUF2127 domain-containing protein n=1 Tax=Citrifermentans bremense TaxID=60035 RepID=UPI0003FFF151|nr:DUF2127 domain-containing protein [Citrifermentans bremense]
MTTSYKGLRLVSIMEGMKGITVLAAGCGVLTLIHKDLHEMAVQLVEVLHLNPARHYPSIFIDTANRITEPQLWLLALSALAYSAVRLAEAYGLWKERPWAEWLGFLSGGIYLPVEVVEIWRKPVWPRIAVFIVNIAVVGYLAVMLKRRKGRPYPR